VGKKEKKKDFYDAREKKKVPWRGLGGKRKERRLMGQTREGGKKEGKRQTEKKEDEEKKRDEKGKNRIPG